MPKRLLITLAAGILSAGLFLLAAGLGVSFFFMSIATLPLFFVGLGARPRLALASGALASGIITLITQSLPLGLLFLLILVLPAWTVSRYALRWRQDGGKAHWFPIGDIMLRLTLYGIAGVAVLTFYLSLSGETIVQMLARIIREAFTDAPPEFAEAVQVLASQMSFMLFSMMLWLWCIGLYAHAWLANRLLLAKHRSLRPDFAITPFVMPNWMLHLLAICALASLIGGESLSFLGKTTLISLLLPYFFLGLALMHQVSKDWPTRRFFLFFIYLSMFVQFWPALILSGVGLWHHIKRLSVPPASSRN